MKISRVTTNADIYTHQPLTMQKIKPPCRPVTIIKELYIYQSGDRYCVLFEEPKGDGVFVNQIDTLRLILLLTRICGCAGCLAERTIKKTYFPPFDINDFS